MSVQARLVTTDSPGADPLHEWVPVDPRGAGALIQLSVGPADGSPGEDLFDVVVGTERYFARIGPQARSLVVDRWDFSEIDTELRRRVAEASGDSWNDVAKQINEWARWEFDQIDETTRRIS